MHFPAILSATLGVHMSSVYTDCSFFIDCCHAAFTSLAAVTVGGWSKELHCVDGAQALTELMD